MYRDNLFKNADQTTINDKVSTPLNELPKMNPNLGDSVKTENHDETEEACNIKIGLVTDCKKLNVREEPRADAAIVCEIAYQTELMIDETESTDEFYKVYTVAGIEGFCMKKFVTIQP